MRRSGRVKRQKEKRGLRVEVKNNNIEWALKKFKRMTKDSELILELKNRTYYEKPSAERRERKSAQAARYKYQNMKERDNY